MAGFPVVISTNGKGLPVRPILAPALTVGKAPVMTIATNGKGAPIVISPLGVPFIVQGYTP